jgi:GPI mannosyltransferase 2
MLMKLFIILPENGSNNFKIYVSRPEFLKNLTSCAIISRFCIICIQFIANHLIPDHNAGVFLSPTENGSKVCDSLTRSLFEGLSRWDAQYFLHLAEHGYTYENTLAFYPLFPFTVGWITQILQLVLPSVCTFRELSLLVAIGLNVIIFVETVKTLHALTWAVFNDRSFADMASLLYCINPASIFFSAVYTESIFALLTFRVMHACHERQSFWRIVIPLCLSILCRSNGILNLGFVTYYSLQQILNGRRRISIVVVKTGLIVVFATVAFVSCQWYFYSLFCKNTNHRWPQHIVDYGKSKELKMPGSEFHPPWCTYRLPISYGYIQNHYWDVGFLKYYQFKQIPNFLLAAPIVVTIFYHCVKFLVSNKDITVRLNLFDLKSQAVERIPMATRQQFVFFVHALALTTFCALFVHIQVSTRMLCSSSPVLCWIFAKYFHDSEKPNQTKQLDNQRVKVLILLYCLSYCLIGTVMFCNFLPWT